MVTPKTRRSNSPSPADIAKKVAAFEASFADVHARMDADEDISNGVVLIDKDDKDEGYKEYSSNDAKTFLDKAISFLSDAAMPLKVPVGSKNLEEREKVNDKERVAFGFLNQAHERLVRQGMTEGLRGHMAWSSTVRGYITGRHMLVKPKDGGDAFVDMMPWDPRRVSWAYGADGIAWACHKVPKTRRMIMEEYGITRVDGADLSKSDDVDVIEIFDWYDGKINKVTTDKQVLKKATPHGHKRIPVHVVPVGVTPVTIPKSGLPDMAHVGDSIFAANRNIYPKKDLLDSIMYELAARSLKPPYIVESPGGDVTLPEPPYLSGVETDIDSDTRVQVMNLHEATQDLGNILGIMTAEIQRGGFPISIFGSIQQSLSGFAINSLSSSVVTIIKPFLNAMVAAYVISVNDLMDAYDTNAFAPMELSGTDNNRDWYSKKITPERIRGLPIVQIKLTANLPKDDISKIGVAAQLKQLQLSDDRTILEDTLEVEDPDQILSRLKEQMAQTASPVAAAFQFMRAALSEEETEMASIYMRQGEIEILKQEIELARALQVARGLIQGPGSQPSTPSGILGPNGQPARMDPRAGPNAILGVPAPEPNQQAGPLVPPGTPRPGAQNGIGPI